MAMQKFAVVFACLVASSTVTAHGGGSGSTGGMSPSNMSAAGLANGNGKHAADRDKGLARAEGRMSATGASHRNSKEKGGKSQNKFHSSQNWLAKLMHRSMSSVPRRRAS